MFNKLTEHIYVRPCDHYTDRPNIGLIVGKNRVLLYDAGNSAANVALVWAEDMTNGSRPLTSYWWRWTALR